MPKNSTQLNAVQVTVTANGQPCDFDTLKLQQSMTDHHRFAIRVNYRPNKPSVWTVTPETIFKQLGTPLTIEMKHLATGETTEFAGIITHIDTGGKDGDQGYVVLSGGSPTLLLDMAPAMEAYCEATLPNIVSQVIEKCGATIEVQNKAKFDAIIPYAARYRESAFTFLARLAASCGEWLYYDGKKLVLGNPKIENDTKAVFDVQLKAVNIAARLGNLNTELYDYDPTENDYKEDAPVKNIDGINSYMRVAREQSDPFFPNPVKLPVARFAIDENDIIAQMRATHSRNFSQMSTFTATANTCAIRLGELVTTTLPENLQKDTGPDLGRYRVTAITHRVDQRGIYENEFTGVAGLTEAMPLPHAQPAQAFPEPATVTDNADPKNQGRVKVRFFWMAEGESSGWIRVQGPNAGFSDNPSKAHGFLFIPSVDDQVMVAYELGDPSRPFVSGSLFHRDNAQGIPAVGTLSAIVSPGGHTIEFFDKEGEEELRILDKARECMIVLSSKGEGIKIITTNDLTLQGKNVTIAAEENITIGAQQNVNIAAEADISTVAKGNLALQSDGDTSLKSQGAIAAEATSDATLTGQNVTVEGKVKADVKGAQTTVAGQMSVLQGAAFKVQVI